MPLTPSPPLSVDQTPQTPRDECLEAPDSSPAVAAAEGSNSMLPSDSFVFSGCASVEASAVRKRSKQASTVQDTMSPGKADASPHLTSQAKEAPASDLGVNGVVLLEPATITPNATDGQSAEEIVSPKKKKKAKVQLPESPGNRVEADDGSVPLTSVDLSSSLKDCASVATVVPQVQKPGAIPDFLDFDRLWLKHEAAFCPEREGRNFALACTIYSVTDINDVQQTFRVKYRLLCNVAITENDFDRHVAMKDPQNWKPTFVPHIRPFNSVEETRWELPGTVGEKYSIQVALNGREKSWVAHFELDCETVFLVPFDVHYCPFDVQVLKMLFQVENIRQSFNRPRHWAQWHWEAPWTAARFAITSMPQGDYTLNRKWIYLERVEDKGRSGREPDQFQVIILAQRNWRFFFWRVMFVLFIINGVTCAAFLFTAFEEMLLFVSTTLVAIVTFLFVVKDMVPHVAYLTMLDYYLYGSFMFICCVVLQVSITKALADKGYFSDDSLMMLRNRMGFVNVSIFLIVNMLWALVCSRGWYSEQHRFDALLQKEHTEARRTSWTKSALGRKSQAPAVPGNRRWRPRLPSALTEAFATSQSRV